MINCYQGFVQTLLHSLAKPICMYFISKYLLHHSAQQKFSNMDAYPDPPIVLGS